MRAALSGLPGCGRLLIVVLLCLALAVVVNAMVAQPFLVPSASMENTLRVGDRILVNKLAYRFGGEVGRGDVVVFDGTGSFYHGAHAGGGTASHGLLQQAAALTGLVRAGESDYTKRVIGVGGDRVVCCDSRGRITVNGASLDESAVLHPGDRPSDVMFDVAVPRGKLFVMGDHRSESRDSRDHLGSPGGGMVPVGRVVGRVERIVWPPSHWRAVESPAAYRMEHTERDAARG